MKQFNLKEYLENPSRQVVTRNGLPVRIICTDAKDTFPIIGLVKGYCGTEYANRFKENGEHTDNYSHIKSPFDLFFAPVKKEGWVNLYYNVCGTVSTDTTVFPTKEFAKASRKYQHYIDTVHIEWEE